MSLDFRTPYSYQMNFAVQRQVTSTISVQAAYVGTLAHKLPLTVDQNYPVLTPTATTGNVDSRRPYQPLNTLSTIGLVKSILNSAYHGLQITGEKRYSRTFPLKGYYVFGKSLDFIDTQHSTTVAPEDWNNINLDRGRTINDRRHNAVISGIWRLDYFRSTPKLVSAVAGRRSPAATATMRSGAPLTIAAGNDRNFDGNSTDRADLIGDPFLDPNRPRSQVVDKWFNAAAFSGVTQARNRFYGTSGRGILDAPGSKNVDMGIYREFRVTEGKTVMFRTEMTNALNLVNLAAPGSSAGNSSTIARITTAGPMRQLQL